MEQKSIGAEPPLTPPSADVAQAYLDEIGAVVERREALVDRRRMAWLELAEAFVLAAFLTFAMFGFGTVTAGSRFLAILATLLFWNQLSNELRESFGGLRRRVGASRWAYLGFAVLLGLSLMAALWLQMEGVTFPVVARFVPGAVMLAIFGWLAIRDLRRQTTRVPREHPPFTNAARLATAGLGLVLGLGVWSAADEMFSQVFALLALVALLIWGFAAYAGGVPALGAIWHWEQWSAFAVGSGTLSAMTLLSINTGVVTWTLAGSAGATVALLFIAVAFIGGRRAD